ncbi:hypothetical protein Pcinc_024291 [Petrolisthes cinctipes]|uniref:Uncharacterized protein n=1 Tax=Petrolisthes cinctipes TaxID=88211 RepID=A0AAE1FA75_PETCI|nr:hypothetical protein Pcinc_024291 [Petrolisthes cinctipes]
MQNHIKELATSREQTKVIVGGRESRPSPSRLGSKSVSRSVREEEEVERQLVSRRLMRWSDAAGLCRVGSVGGASSHIKHNIPGDGSVLL